MRPSAQGDRARRKIITPFPPRSLVRTWRFARPNPKQIPAGSFGRIDSDVRISLRALAPRGLTAAVSPHYYYPTDKGWKFEGALEKLMHGIGMFDRRGPYVVDGFENSGADFMPQYKPHILDNKTIITSPHKMYGPEQNDLALQLRKRHIDQVILAGMSANLCVEAHLRELLEQGFEVAVVKDATAAAVIPDGDGYLAAITNFRFIANAVWTTEETLARLRA